MVISPDFVIKYLLDLENGVDTSHSIDESSKPTQLSLKSDPGLYSNDNNEKHDVSKASVTNTTHNTGHQAKTKKETKKRRERTTTVTAPKRGGITFVLYPRGDDEIQCFLVTTVPENPNDSLFKSILEPNECVKYLRFSMYLFVQGLSRNCRQGKVLSGGKFDHFTKFH